MSKQELHKKRISFFQRFITKVKHGLFFQIIRNQLAKIGIEITPFYWVREGVHKAKLPELKYDSSLVEIFYLQESDFKSLEGRTRGYSVDKFLEWYSEGRKCIGLKCENEIAAIMWINPNNCSFKPHYHALNSNEAYLSAMYTMEDYRGQNIAPYLRFKSYESMAEIGIDNVFSVSEYFNFAARRFKEKLGAQNLQLFLYFSLFKLIRFKILVKNFNKSR